MIKRPTADAVTYCAVILIIAALYAVFSRFTPKCLDDLGFLALYRDYSGGSDLFSLKALAGYASELREFDNARLSNVLSPFSTIIHPWCDIFPLLTGICFAAIIVLGMHLAGITAGRRSAVAIFLWLALILFLPWRNYIIVADYALNYIYASVVTLAAISMLTTDSRHLCRPAVMAGAMLLVLVAGLWHEGFSVPVISGMAVLALVRRLKMGWRRWLHILIYIVATAYVMMSPGVLSRTSNEFTFSIRAAGAMWKIFIDLALPIVLAVNVVALCLFARGRQLLCRVMRSDAFIVILTASVVSTAISLVIFHTPRTAFFPTLTALLSLVILYRKPIELIAGSRCGRAAAVIAGILCVAQTIHVIHWQRRIFDESNTITEELKRSNGTIYYDAIPADDVPLTTLLIPTRDIWSFGFHQFCVARSLGMPDAAVVPTSLKEIPAVRDTVSAPGDKLVVMRANGELFTDWLHDFDIRFGGNLEFSTAGDSTTRIMVCNITNFTSTTGDSLAYIMLRHIDVNDIRRARLIPVTHDDTEARE